MHVLLVEDDGELAAAMKSFLGARGFVVSTAACLADARKLLPLSAWAVVLLDLHLPDGDGLSLLPTIQRHAPDASTLILTAKDQVSDRIRGLDAGADDYLVKPFDTDELLARLRAIQRRGNGGGSAVMNFGRIDIDLPRKRVTVDKLPVELTAKEWTLLQVLATRADRVHSKESLLSALYGFDEEADSNTLEVFISNLRRKLGKDAIQTLRGIGYRFTGSRA
ncbi:MAG: response regulator transcription factor [Betaproteobacteria bacterium]|nr:response regulator transcription factor [Betaproteobacteria bacterium]MBK7655095.1 response regulator transcription factor [Betaproteobacteria bacterium]MBP6644214.1 response regulator transcription factor [Burkholderiaceae bacterium]